MTYTTVDPKQAIKDMRAGKLVVIGGKTYGFCKDCQSVIRMDKPVFGSLHICK